MWSQRTERLPNDRGLRITVDKDATPLTYARALALLESDESFRDFLLKLLAAAPYTAFRWETPPICASTVDRPFEFVLLDSPRLERAADFGAFEAPFAGDPQASVLAFRNLSGDAELIVPGPRAAATAYCHFAAFIRHAPVDQQHALWQLTAQVVGRQLGRAPLWLSTAGAGVPWLHVRVDTSPKYYGYAAYREP